MIIKPNDNMINTLEKKKLNIIQDESSNNIKNSNTKTYVQDANKAVKKQIELFIEQIKNDRYLRYFSEEQGIFLFCGFDISGREINTGFIISPFLIKEDIFSRDSFFSYGDLFNQV